MLDEVAPAPQPAPRAASKTVARTMLGIVASDVLPQGLAAPAGAAPAGAAPPAGAVAPGPTQPMQPNPAARTIVGMPARALVPGAEAGAPGGVSRTVPDAADEAAPGRPGPTAPGDSRSSMAHTMVVGTPAAVASHVAPPQVPQAQGGTLLGQPVSAATVALGGARGALPAGALPAGAGGASGTLLGVARPGIAPIAPGVDETVDDTPGLADEGTVNDTVDEPPRELGATLVPQRAPRAPSPRDMQLVRRQRRPAPEAGARPRKEAAPGPSRRALALVIAGGVLAVFAVLFVVFWPDPPPVTARARVDAGGRDVLEVRCQTCPDGTAVSVGEARATVTGGVAQIPLAAPLSVGDNRMKVAIDRPGKGRDETIAVSVGVAYRIRPDLATLQGERPTLQVVVEAMGGTEVLLDGKALSLSGGRAVEVVDVSDAITGPADEPRTLSRQIPYAVTPPDGPREQGVVSVSVGVVPLRIDAPGPSVVIDKESFVLEGRTAKGAQIFAGPHPIPVRADGSFAHVMNVSSVGATQFEVRARMEGMAPRLVKIAVRRVDRLETAARDFAGQKPIGWAELAADPKAQLGKPVVLAGEVLEARRQGHATVTLLSVSPASGCKAAGSCKARLVHGVQVAAQRGDTLTAYGRVAPPFAGPGGEAIPEVQVEFAIPAIPAAGSQGAAPKGASATPQRSARDLGI